MKTRGKVFKYGANVDTDVIIPARYLTTADPDELAAHCMEDLDRSYVERVEPGDVIVAGDNFGCGSSREHAPIAIKASGAGCVIAPSFARIFYRNSINMGLPILESAEAVAALNEGDRVEVDFDSGEILNVDNGEVYQAEAFPPFVRKIIEQGGLVAYTESKRNNEKL